MILEFLLDNAILSATAAALGVGTVLLWMQPTDGSALDPYQAVRLINDSNAAVLDMRAKKDFDAGHIPGAKHAASEDIAAKAAALAAKNRPLLLVCGRGADSRTRSAKLRQGGIEQVHSLKGGLLAWNDSGQPLSKSK